VGLAPALKETSNYYLIAWKPDTETQKQGRFRNVEVKLIGHPDYTVRVRKGYFDLDSTQPTTAKQKDQPPAPQNAAAKLRESLTAPYPERALPILMSVDYYDIAGKGPMVNTSVQVPGEFLAFGEQPDGKIQAVLDLSGLFLDDQGNVKDSFVQRIVTTAPDLEATKSFKNDIIFHYPVKLTPGLYQIRVAARDDKGGKAGSAHAWIEVPDLTKKKLAMSSLLLGERTQPTMTNVSKPGDANPVVQPRVDLAISDLCLQRDAVASGSKARHRRTGAGHTRRSTGAHNRFAKSEPRRHNGSGATSVRR
jgi:hypothetical protein